MAFRFRVENDGQVSFTQWHDEPIPSPAAQIATQIRRANPNAKLQIERRHESAADLNQKGGDASERLST